MHKTENKNAPNLGGWLIGVAAGAVAFGVLLVVGKFDLFPAAAMAGVVAGAAGVVLGMPWGQGPVMGTDAALAAGKSKPAPAPTPAAFVSAPVAAAAPKAKAEVKPKAAAKAPAEAAGPERLKAPRKGKADDLKEIEGIGPAMEKLVNGLGFYHFEQIASWSDADVALVDDEMKSFKGRIARDRWVAQAKLIVAEGVEAFRIRAKTNNY
jgi:predicted flap endonuclease-1-like 5' DNA nuclease